MQRGVRRERARLGPSTAARGYDREWRRIRATVLSQVPYCERCGSEATQVHHVPDFPTLGRDHHAYRLHALCAPCHTRETIRSHRRRE